MLINLIINCHICLIIFKLLYKSLNDCKYILIKKYILFSYKIKPERVTFISFLPILSCYPESILSICIRALHHGALLCMTSFILGKYFIYFFVPYIYFD